MKRLRRIARAASRPTRRSHRFSVEALGELLVSDESFYPVRFLTTGFPSKERLHQVPSDDSEF